MPSLGPAEVLVILVIALLVFGPNKMPEVARQAGNAFRELRRAQQHLKSELSGAMSDLQASGTRADTDSLVDTGVAQVEPSSAGGGGDPVPMLPPLDDTTSAPAATDAATRDPAPSAGPNTEAGTGPPAPSSPPPADPA